MVKEAAATRARREFGQNIVKLYNPHGYLSTSRKLTKEEKMRKPKGGKGMGHKAMAMAAAMFYGLAMLGQRTGMRGK